MVDIDYVHIEAIEPRTSWVLRLPYEIIDELVEVNIRGLLALPKDPRVEIFGTYDKYVDNKMKKEALDKLEKGKEKQHQKWGFVKDPKPPTIMEIFDSLPQLEIRETYVRWPKRLRNKYPRFEIKDLKTHEKLREEDIGKMPPQLST